MRISEITESQSGRIDELKGVKNAINYYQFRDDLSRLPDTWTSFQGYILERFVDDLHTDGFRVLGNGQFGIVFAHPGIDYVIKIFRSDPAFLHFVSFVRKYKSDPHLPKFRGGTIKIDRNTCAVRIEKLTSFDMESVYGSVMSFAQMYASAHYKAEPVDPDDFIDQRAAKYFKEDYAEVLPHLKANASLLTTMCRISKENGDFHLDLHEGNFMMRGQIIVVTDPFCLNNFRDLDGRVLAASKDK